MYSFYINVFHEAITLLWMEVELRDGRRNYLLYNFLKNDLKEQKLTAKYIKMMPSIFLITSAFFAKLF